MYVDDYANDDAAAIGDDDEIDVGDEVDDDESSLTRCSTKYTLI